MFATRRTIPIIGDTHAGFTDRSISIASDRHLLSRLALLSLALASNFVLADQHIDESVFFEDFPVVLSVTRLSQPLAEAPAAVTIIDRNLMKSLDLRELPDLLRYVTGMVVGRESGHWPVVTYQGLSDTFSRRLQILVDGRSVYLPSIGGALWTDLGIFSDDIERIEVIRGPNAAAYGPNSFLGVINIITRHPAETVGATAWTRLGDHGVRDWFVRGGSSGGDMDWRVSLGGLKDDGFRGRHDGKDVWSMNAILGWQPNTQDTVMTRLGVLRSNNQEGDGSNDAPERDLDTASDYLHLRWERSDLEGNGFSAQYYYNRHGRMDEFIVIATPLHLPIDQNILSERHDFEFEGRLSFEATRLIYGLGARLDRVKSKTFFNTNAALENKIWRLYGNIEHRLRGDLIVNLGALYENNDIMDDRLSPRLGINWLASPEHAFRIIASRATRTPVLFEEMGNYTLSATPLAPFDFLGPQTLTYSDSSGGLDSETIDALEIGYHATLSRDSNLDFRVFQNRLDDLIIDDGSDFLNRENVTLRGIDLQIDVRPTHWLRLLAGTSAYSVESSSNRFDQSVPANTFSLAATLSPDVRTTLGIGVYRYGTITWMDGDAPINTDPYIDISARRDFKLGLTTAFIQFTARDLSAKGFDKRSMKNPNSRHSSVWLRLGAEF